jgi:ATP synthase protein I
MNQDDPFEKRLNEALKREHLTEEAVPEPAEEADPGMAEASEGLAYGMRIGVEFVSGTVVGLLIGWGIDSWLDTTPWFLLLFVILGFAAGVMNVYRVINNLDEGIGINRQNHLTK